MEPHFSSIPGAMTLQNGRSAPAGSAGEAELLAEQTVNHDFTDVLGTLRSLTRNHLVFYRLEVGKVLLQSFFGGSTSAYLDRSPTKAGRFAAFYEQFEAELAELGLKEQVLRQCIVTHIVVQTLPAEVVEQLEFSKLVALTRVKDPTQRARLAKTAVDEGWPVARLREAIDLAMDGLFYDADPEQPGVQPPVQPTSDAAKPKPGVVINRVERWAKEAGAWVDALGQVEAQKLTPAQRERLRQALDEVRGRLDGVVGGIGGG